MTETGRPAARGTPRAARMGARLAAPGRRAAVAASAALACACAGRSAPDPRDLAPGAELCYTFERNEAAERMGLPWGFALSGSAVSGEGAHAASTLYEDGRRMNSPIEYWRMVGDSLELGSRTMGPVQLVLGGAGERLEGRARATGDIAWPGDPPRPEAAGVVAEQVACPGT